MQEPRDAALDLGAAQKWLDHMLDGCAIYRPVREDGVIVDFDRVYLNRTGADLRREVGADLALTLMREAAPGVVESELFANYVGVVESQVPWSGVDVSFDDLHGEREFDIQAWPVGGNLAVTWRDVTEREQTARLLRLSEQRFKATVDQLPDAVSVFESVRDQDGGVIDFRWVYCNVYNADMTGYTVAELVGQRLLDVFPEQRAAGMIDVYSLVVESGESWQAPTVWYEDTWGDGTRRRRAFDVRASKVGDGFVVVSRDVTDLRLINESLEQNQVELSARNQTLADLIGVIGHDLRNPIMATAGFLDLAKDAIAGDGKPFNAPAAVEFARRAAAANHRVEGLLGDILEMARLDEQHFVGKIEVIDVCDVVTSALADLGEGYPVELSVPARISARADASQVRQIVCNLVTNAFKYGAEPVSVSARYSGDRVEIAVTDAGPGVPPDFAPRMFERFSRAGSDQPGTGLGLYLSKSMCRASEGDLTYQPMQPGSRFVVNLAAASAH